ncbi:TniQ family protein [Pseudomonas putida]|uniref:TniQ family protein n=1 Tax=Pseudomonas putida TaxID=303 RepID=UPI001C2138F9
MLPIHPNPLPDELFSSWMVRLAFANGFALHTFYSSLLGFKEPIWNRDSDRHPPIALLNCLCTATGKPIDLIKALTLSFYEGQVFESFPVNGDVPFLLPVGLYHRTRRRAGIQFCSQCLKLDPAPYYRRHWRLALSTVCSLHDCMLEQSCPSCGSPIIFHRHGMGRSKRIYQAALSTCSKCCFSLDSAEPRPTKCANSSEGRALLAMTHMVQHGCWDGSLQSEPLSLSFFGGLRIILGLVCGRHGARLRAVLSSELGRDICPLAHLDFEYQPVEVRYALLLAAFSLLADWPLRFREACKSAKVTRSRFADAFSIMPYWLRMAVDQYLDTRIYLPPAEEVAAAARYLQRADAPVSTSSLGALLGCKRSMNPTFKALT